ncbi:hypothetical protein GGR50DRAFT_703773 [Xylaria sp. CBS 124048]|nr:hypothetical protein GGR50DRAFT_703773 [Xylaria sp. CBS 124048]
MAPATDPQSQIYFLACCIQNTPGKVDFNKVVKEFGITTKGAAAKRFERIMKGYNNWRDSVKKEDGEDGTDGDEAKTTKTSKAKAKPAVSKKRRLQAVLEEDRDLDTPLKAEELAIKGEVKYEDAIVKPECLKDESPMSTPLPRPPSQSHPTPSTANAEDDDEDEVLFVYATEKRVIPDMPADYSDPHSSYDARSLSTMNDGHHPLPTLGKRGRKGNNTNGDKHDPLHVVAPAKKRRTNASKSKDNGVSATLAGEDVTKLGNTPGNKSGQSADHEAGHVDDDNESEVADDVEA